MAEANDILSNRRHRLKKRRKLNIHNAMQEDTALALITPRSQRVGDWIGGTHDPIVIDLTGCDDMPIATPIPETPQSNETSGDEAVAYLARTSTDDGSSRKATFVHIPRPCLTQSAFGGWHPPETLWPERDVLTHPDSDGVQYFDLNDFTFYRLPWDSKRAMEMSTLDRLQISKGVDKLCFSGRLSTATASYYVHGVEFSILAVDGYGDHESANLHDKLCIQSQWARARDVWYRLGHPSAEYSGFHKDYLWLATFTKYFIDFLLEQEADITLHGFRSKFLPWIQLQYGESPQFQAWHEKCGYQQDFGTSAAAYVNYLYKECYSIDDSTSQLLKHSFWREVDPANLTAIPRQPTDLSGATVVTPFAFRCFQDMYFAAHLQMHHPVPDVQAAIEERKQRMSLTPWDTAPVARPPPCAVNASQLRIRKGDVICTHPNANDQWKRSKSEVWYAYVSGIHTDRQGRTKLDVLWLYEPSDTTLGNAYYPFQNELFLSDNCSCGEHGIPLEAVVAKLDVTWFVTDPHAVEGYFARQKFQTVEAEDSYGFVTLNSKDFSCHDSHLSDFELCRQYYRLGQSVLVCPSSDNDPDVLLQPMRIIRFNADKQQVILHRFDWASEHDSTAPSNELVESNREAAFTADRVVRTCKVGRFLTREEVTLPFNRGGLGDHFYTLSSTTVTNSQTTLQTPPDSDSEDTRPKSSSGITSHPLTGLDLYCGGGNFGRGLEEAGVVKMLYAVDWDEPAIHSYRANTENPIDVQYFLGSVNDYLREVLHGSTNPNIAAIGVIDFAAGGSPCPGFSNMQPNKQSERSLRFASMVASVVAFIDTYSPQYFILENVVTMNSKIEVNGQQQNVFSQILASFVALGYQVQQFLGDAWSLGSSQSRSRVFIVASAPGTVPLQPPPSTHGHPPGKEIKRSLGRTTNGLPFGIRRFESTTFPYVSAEEATQDLPDIGDSLTQICPQFPDHRTTYDQSFVTRQRLMRVPTHPRETGLVQAVYSGNVKSGEAYEWVNNLKPTGVRAKKEGRSYSRIRPDGLFPTILTALHLQDGINGNVLHWEQHRSISIMETRRAQGFLDHEVLVGYPSQQLKIVGNSVDRKVALAMGLVIKESWDETLKLKREMLRGNTPATGTLHDQEAINMEGDCDYAQGRRSVLAHPSPTQVEIAKRESREMRTKSFLIIMQRLGHSQQKRSDVPSQIIAAQLGSQRWSGDSPADAIAIRRREQELDTVLPLHQVHSP
jgi:DNA (cytosine-5)-methyltransferase 1